ncbi:MAG TPA: DNA primase [Candidatus Obscuribacterales bacterium]
MKGVTSEVIAEVRNRANIHEVVADVVVLKRANKIYKGLCPFHNEKTPSFIVNPERGIFNCFGCNEKGDVFAFVQKSKNIGFVDAVRELAHRYGVALVETADDRREFDRRTLIMMLYQQANEYFRKLLHDPAHGYFAMEYLEKRGVTPEIIERFQLGYAPNTWDALLNYLTQSNKVTPQTLLEAGLVRHKAETDRYYDLFRHRLMIPIHDDQGRVIAFGGRTLDPNDQVKYINSPETPIYIKGDHLYGLNQAKDAIKQQDNVIVVEGYFDVMTAHQYGFAQTVATCGTALTERQAKLLVRYTESKRVFLCFDADVAGQKAVNRNTQTINQIAEGVGIELRVISVPGGKDPDECLRGAGEHTGVPAFTEAVDKAPLLIDYQLEKAISGVDIKSHTGRIEAARLIVPILAEVKNAVARGEYIRQWSVKLSLREEELLTDVGQYRRQQKLAFPVARIDDKVRIRAAQKNAPKTGFVEAEKQLLALYLMSKADYEAARKALTDDRLIDPAHRRIKEAIEGIGSFGSAEDFQYRLMDRLGPDPEASAALVDIILKLDELQRQNLPREVILKDNRARILQERLNQGKNRFRALLPTAASDEEQATLQSKIMSLQQLETQALRDAQTDDQIAEIRRKIDSLLPETIK